MKLRIILNILAVVFLGSCTGKKLELPQTVFYPEAPHPPRIQFLAALGDFGENKVDEHFINFPFHNELNRQDILKPYGMAFMGNKLLLCDTKRSGLWVLDLNQQLRWYLKLRTRKAGGKMVNLVLDEQESKYVADIGRDFLLLYDQQNKPMKRLTDIGRPVDVAVYQDKVYILDRQNHMVRVWNKNLTDPLVQIGKMGYGAGEFLIPSSLTVDDHGFLYVVDTGNNRVQKFDQDGRFLLSIGKLGDTPGCFIHPKGIAVDRNGNIYVADAMLKNVQLFDPQGNLLLYFGQVPLKELNLKLPAQIILDYDHIDYFKQLAAPDFELEYLILISNQLGPNKVNVYGFGHQKTYSSPAM